MRIYENAVRKPITTILLFAAVVIFGLFSLSRLSVDLYPEIELNAVTVMTSYVGASAEDIEQNVTKRMEMSLSTVSDLKRISSISKDNVSLIILEFEYGTNMDEAVNDVRGAVDMLANMLPDDADKPVILKFSSSMMPIAFLSARTDKNPQGLYKLLEEKVANPINRVNGVASVSIVGAPEREIQVLTDPKKLEAYNLSIEAIAGVLAMENRNIPGGSIDIGSETFTVKTDGEFTSSDQIKDVIIGSFMGRNIHVRDVAEVKDTLKERSTEVLTNGVTSAQIVVQKQSGANVVEIANKINQELPTIRKGLPEDVELEMVIDTSDFIKKSINSLTETVLLAGLFVMIVVLLFLGRWRATFIIIITIPVSLITAFIYLMATGNSLNIISLSSLSIAIGMVVDDAIVVLENITTHIERGAKPKDAAIYATNEVAVAVIASTLTIVAVFFPLTMVGGLAGIMFRQLGWIVTIIITVSTIAALTLTPMLSSLLLQQDPKRSKFFETIYAPVERGLDALDSWYEKFLRFAVTHRAVIIISSIAIFGASTLLLSKVGTDFFPESDDSQISVKVELPVGTRVEKARELNQYIYGVWREKYPEIDVLQTNMGESDGTNIFLSMRGSGSNLISYTVRMCDRVDRDRDIFEIADLMRGDLAQIPEIYRYEVNPGGGGMGSGGSDIEIHVFGFDMEVSEQVAQEVATILNGVKGLRDVKVTREDYKPQLQVEFDRVKLAHNGLTTTAAASAVRNRIHGATASYFREEGEEYDIVVKSRLEDRESIEDILAITLQNSSGDLIRLSEVASIRESFAPPSIEHLDRERMVRVVASSYKRALGDIVKDIDIEFEKMTLPMGIALEIGGAYEDQQESFGDMYILLILVVLLTFIVMASQFESFRDPLIIMSSLPFAFTGVFIALWITGTSLSLIALIGGIMLVGIVVKNGIVLIDYINLNKERGMSVMNAVISGGKSRLRPVLMTTMTTILGMLPMAIGLGEGSEIWQPMGISIIGGLTISTVLTLIVMPTIYTSLEARTMRKEREERRLSAKNGRVN